MWTPPPNVTSHNSEALSPDCDFFVAPPPEIGAVRTAYTSLKKGVQARPLAFRAALAAVAGVVGFLLTWGFDSLTKILFVLSDMTRTPVILWELAFVPLWVYLGWRKSRFHHFCTFSGDAGCAHYQCENERSNMILTSSFRFADAAAVSTRTVRHTKNGVYQGTHFSYQWYTATSKVIYSITGNHMAEYKPPPPENFYYFAGAVESAWYRYAAPKIDAEYAQRGAVSFYMGGKYNCVLSPGVIDFVDEQGKSSRCSADEIASAKLSDGQLTIRRKDARRSFFDLFNSEGVFSFPYATIHNARLFLYLFERSVGVKVQ